MKKLFILLTALIVMGCECPYLEEQTRPYFKKSGSTLTAEKLPGLWQCYYPMIIGGVEFKEVRMYSNGKADIIMEKLGGSPYYAETFSYSFDGRWLRFTKTGVSYAFQITDYISPELFLRDSNGTYTMAFRRTEECIR